LQLGDGFQIPGSTGSALQFDQRSEINASEFHAEGLDDEPVWQQIAVSTAADEFDIAANGFLSRVWRV
jgi:hypothetical protein